MKVLICSLVILFSQISWAQQTNLPEDKTQIKKVIHLLFDGMKEGDSAKVHLAFHPEVRMLTSYYNKDNNPAMMEESLQDFLNAVGTPHNEIWDERITDFTINVDDNLSQVWIPYKFYVNDAFSHCGVNAIQLIKDNSGNWKIIHITDTRRKNGCE